ncbi:unnamed protein product, partial [Cladocopium goreaui]
GADRMAMTAEDYARIAREVEAALEEAAKEGSPVSFDRPHADKNQNRPEGCSGKKERAMRKEQMREYQEMDRIGNLESKERDAGLGDGDSWAIQRSDCASRQAHLGVQYRWG